MFYYYTCTMNSIVLFEEYRFIEKSENDISSAWKGAHLLLFFLAFVFGSICTFCFYMLMYLFDEKCVLFPKLLSLTSMQHNVLYEYIPDSKEFNEALPVDFVGTRWVDKSICYLPTFVPLVSGICGLVWTTMFLMCSSGSQTLTGLQRPWRVLPPVFVFSLAMSGLCIYASSVTDSGLEALCVKLGELTNSTSCSYTINVATLIYERRIRGVYQATKLTITTAWLHTACWIFSAVLTLVRVLLAVDFQLVKVSVELQGDIEMMLERHERHLRTVSPESEEVKDKGNQSRNEYNRRIDIASIIYKNKHFKTTNNLTSLRKETSDIIYVSKLPQDTSEMALVPSEKGKLAKRTTYEANPKDKYFIASLLYDLLKSLEITESSSSSEVFSLDDIETDEMDFIRQIVNDSEKKKILEPKNFEEAAQTQSQNIIYNQLIEIPTTSRAAATDSGHYLSNIYNSSTSISAEIREKLELRLIMGMNKSDGKRIKKLTNKSNLKNISIQTRRSKKKRRQRKVYITESKSIQSIDTQHETGEKEEQPDKETQTPAKEKQD